MIEQTNNLSEKQQSAISLAKNVISLVERGRIDVLNSQPMPFLMSAEKKNLLVQKKGEPFKNVFYEFHKGLGVNLLGVCVLANLKRMDDYLISDKLIDINTDSSSFLEEMHNIFGKKAWQMMEAGFFFDYEENMDTKAPNCVLTNAEYHSARNYAETNIDADVPESVIGLMTNVVNNNGYFTVVVKENICENPTGPVNLKESVYDTETDEDSDELESDFDDDYDGSEEAEGDVESDENF